MLIRERINNFKNKVYQTANSIVLPGGLLVPKNLNILAVIENEEGKFLHAAHNIVTNDGDIYYAQKSVGASPTDAFTTLYLSHTAWAATHPKKSSNASNLPDFISGGSKAVDGTYPLTNDGDTDNTGAGVNIVTWRFSYGKADFADTAVISGAIGIASETFGSGAGHILTGFTLSSFAKTTNDTLKVFVNHTMLGV